jgi:hypothetical protein
MIGDCVVVIDGSPRRFRPLSVRELVSMQNVLAQRSAEDALNDAKAAGLNADAALARAKDARETARLTSSVIRWCFTLEGASNIVSCSTGSGNFAEATDGFAPDDFTQLALQLVGFSWSDEKGKWVRRSQPAANGAENG